MGERERQHPISEDGKLRCKKGQERLSGAHSEAQCAEQGTETLLYVLYDTALMLVANSCNQVMVLLCTCFPAVSSAALWNLVEQCD